MASTYSPNLQIQLPATGDQSGTWSTTNNTNLGTLIEQAISGNISVSCSGGTDGTGAMTAGVSATPRNMYLTLTGTGGGTLVVPTNAKLYFIYNSTSAAITVRPGTFSPNTPTGTGISVPAAASYALYCNGTNIVNAISANSIAGVVSANPTASLGLTAINGSATSFMRSDAAPALDVTIVPTWTGAHIWSAAATFNSTASFTGAVTFTSTTNPTINDGAGNQFAVGFRGLPQNAKTGAYVVTVTDAGKSIPITTGGVTVNASIFSAGDAFTIYNNSGSSQIVTAGTNVTFRLAGTATTGNRTLAQYGVMTLLCILGSTNPVFVCMGPGVS